MRHLPSRRFRAALLAFTLASLLVAAVMRPEERAFSAASPTPDPRLILHPHTVTAHGAISRHDTLTLHLYPAIPGKQRVEVMLPPRVHPLSLALRVTMSGMPMPAIHCRLARRGRVYGGTLTLPMFGPYLVTVSVPRYQAVSLRILLPLPIG